MDHYNHTRHLQEIWLDACEKYRAGNRQPETYFDADQLSFLSSVGLHLMDVYDYAEDFETSKEPDFATFLSVCEARRDYFLTVQESVPSTKQLDPETLPAKTDSVRGIVWLPRILPKAKAKLRGELPPEIMYGCGGDRRFFKENNLHPAEFLRVNWAYEDSPEKIIDWVEARRMAAHG
ncbi:MAG: DUF5069 domain-containing protein [Coraliomargarita sp. TMED73]|nr:MAG: DUF5069 domain-containing protein [Coraliomargarita sp. TMED73]